MGNIAATDFCKCLYKKEQIDLFKIDTNISVIEQISAKRIQSLYRGYLYRSKLYPMFKTEYIKRLMKIDMNKIPGEILDINYEPNITNPKIKELQKLLPAFSLTEKEKYILKISNLHKNAIKYKDGCVYKGFFNKDWLKEGFGVLYMPDQSIYEGFFKTNLMEGRGRVLNADGVLYDGEFANNKANGYGKYMSLEGLTYVGSWKDEKQHGQGDEIFQDGSRYEGEYFMGKKTGKGKFTWPNGVQYFGDLSNNDFHGSGTYKWKDGRIYQGQWQHNKMHGNGIFYWPDKKVYIGAYKTDNKHGFGCFIWPDGRKYEGFWELGKQHGLGSYFHPKEIIIFGEWNKGIKVEIFDYSDEKYDHCKNLIESKRQEIQYLYEEYEKSF
jgi:hypothetical protein